MSDFEITFRIIIGTILFPPTLMFVHKIAVLFGDNFSTVKYPKRGGK